VHLQPRVEFVSTLVLRENTEAPQMHLKKAGVVELVIWPRFFQSQIDNSRIKFGGMAILLGTISIEMYKENKKRGSLVATVSDVCI